MTGGAVRGKRARLHVPVALVRMAGMQAGPLTLMGESGEEWETTMLQEHDESKLYVEELHWDFSRSS